MLGVQQSDVVLMTFHNKERLDQDVDISRLVERKASAFAKIDVSARQRMGVGMHGK